MFITLHRPQSETTYTVAYEHIAMIEEAGGDSAPTLHLASGHTVQIRESVADVERLAALRRSGSR